MDPHAACTTRRLRLRVRVRVGVPPRPRPGLGPGARRGCEEHASRVELCKRRRQAVRGGLPVHHVSSRELKHEGLGALQGGRETWAWGGELSPARPASPAVGAQDGPAALTVVPQRRRPEELSNEKDVRWCVVAGRLSRRSTETAAASLPEALAGARRRSHTRTVPSLRAPEASSLPSGEKHRCPTPPPCPASDATTPRLPRRSSSSTPQSKDPRAARPLPSGHTASADALVPCGRSSTAAPGRCMSNWNVDLAPPASSFVPSAENATHCTSSMVSPATHGEYAATHCGRKGVQGAGRHAAWIAWAGHARGPAKLFLDLLLPHPGLVRIFPPREKLHGLPLDCLREAQRRRVPRGAVHGIPAPKRQHRRAQRVRSIRAVLRSRRTGEAAAFTLAACSSRPGRQTRRSPGRTSHILHKRLVWYRPHSHRPVGAASQDLKPVRGEGQVRRMPDCLLPAFRHHSMLSSKRVRHTVVAKGVVAPCATAGGRAFG